MCTNNTSVKAIAVCTVFHQKPFFQCQLHHLDSLQLQNCCFWTLLFCQPVDDENNLESDEEKGSIETVEAWPHGFGFNTGEGLVEAGTAHHTCHLSLHLRFRPWDLIFQALRSRGEVSSNHLLFWRSGQLDLCQKQPSGFVGPLVLNWKCLDDFGDSACHLPSKVWSLAGPGCLSVGCRSSVRVKKPIA